MVCTKTQRRPAPRGFTLIELLVVVAIIALLVGILMPAFTRAKNVARSTATQSRLASLEAACESFKQDHNAYPGVAKWYGHTGGDYNKTVSVLTDLNDDNMTGAQVLAMCLRGYCFDLDNVGTWITLPTTVGRSYSDFKDEDIDSDNRILDTFPEAMPILYWVARPGQVRLQNIYRYEDNTGAAGYPTADASDFYDYITNPASQSPTYGDLPYRQDSFILMAPGIDREWFTNDDNRNFNQ